MKINIYAFNNIKYIIMLVTQRDDLFSKDMCIYIIKHEPDFDILTKSS